MNIENHRRCGTIALAIKIIANESVTTPEKILEAIADVIGANEDDKKMILDDLKRHSPFDLSSYTGDRYEDYYSAKQNDAVFRTDGNLHKTSERRGCKRTNATNCTN
jgi:hypothetical protein